MEEERIQIRCLQAPAPVGDFTAGCIYHATAKRQIEVPDEAWFAAPFPDWEVCIIDNCGRPVWVGAVMRHAYFGKAYRPAQFKEAAGG